MSPRHFELPTPVSKIVMKISKLLRTRRQISSHSRSPGSSPLTAITIDVIEGILLCLPGQDIIGMKQV